MGVFFLFAAGFGAYLLKNGEDGYGLKPTPTPLIFRIVPLKGIEKKDRKFRLSDIGKRQEGLVHL